MSLRRMNRNYPQEPRYAPHKSKAPAKDEEQGCCYDRNDDISYSLQDTYCFKCFLVVFRIVVFAVLCVRFYLNMRDTPSLFILFKFLTDFGFSMTIIFYALCMWDLLLNSCGSKKSPHLPKAASILYQIALPTQVIVTALYWIIVYEGTHTTTEQWVKDIGNHGFPLIVLLLDYLINLIPFYAKHIFILLVTVVFYLLVNLGFTLAVRPVYSAIDWKSGASYAWVVASVAVMGIVHCVCQLIWYKCKRPKLQQISQQQGR